MNRRGSAASTADSLGAYPTTYTGKSDRRRSERTMQLASGLLFPGGPPSPTTTTTRADLMADGPPPYGEERTNRFWVNPAAHRRA